MILFEKKILFLIIPSFIFIFNALIIFNPAEIMQAARGGTILWFNNVLPSLLPFMIGTNMLLRLGVVSFIGALLEPIMRPLFGVSGRGAFALAMGAISGYPIGAQVCATLRENEEISQVEAQRLLSFVNNSGPLFMIGAVGAGMFGNERVGYFIFVTTLIGALVSGMLFKFYKREERVGEEQTKTRLANVMPKNKDPIGKILSESVFKSLEGILLIGGFIILFSVMLKALEVTLIIDFMDVSENGEVLRGAIYGFFEITNGVSKLAELDISKSVIILCSAIVSFGGMSIFAQSVAFLSKTDIKPAIFFMSKLLNAILTAVAGVIIYPFWDFGAKEAEVTATVFAITSPGENLMLSTIMCVMAIFTIMISAFAAKISWAYKKGKKPY